ncbi:MAG: hypothetical protein HZB26_14355 [Candidatus Hydrogenedentes bacterium]|nr:hypothetical protein [Candidatus Hydrogenedentota bacterium]
MQCGRARFRRTARKRLCCCQTRRSKSVESAAFSPDGGQILTTSWDNTAKVWNAESGAESFGLAGHTDSVVCGAFSGDGSRIATGSADHTVRIWDAKGGQLIRTLQGHTGEVAAVAFGASGRLASGSADNSIRVWNAETGQCVHVLEGHSHTVGAVAFSPDGSRLVSGSLEGDIKVWNTQTGKELVTLQGHTGAIIRVAFATDAHDALSTSYDGTLRRWRAAPWQMASWPGSPQMDISDRFKLYRKTQRPPTAPPDGEPTQVYVATTPENSRDALARLTAPIAKAAAPITADGDIYNALAGLCVLRGDELTAINETPLAAGESAPQAVTALSQRLSADPAAAWTLSLRRHGRAITYRIAPTQRVEQNLEYELPREDARKLFEAQEDRLRRFADNTLEQNRLRATDIGAPVSGPNGLSGIWLSDGSADTLKPYYLTIGVAAEDRVTQINGQPVTDFAALARQVSDLSAAVTRGEPLSLTLEVERGRFVRNHIRVAVR